MNLIMHGLSPEQFTTYNDDTIYHDNFGDEKFTIQVNNPPFSLQYRGEKTLLSDPRYSAVGVLPPKSHADYAFVEQMLYHMDPEDGRLAVILPHGVLFRGGTEATIRKYIVRDLNRLDAVIGLAPNLFHGASIPVCILILRSHRNGNSGNVCFINAEKLYKKGKAKNTLEPEHIDKIVQTYIDRKNVDKFCHIAPMSEIIANDYNLNIPRYVDTTEEEPPVDLNAVIAQRKQTDKEIDECVANLMPYFNALGLKFPGEDGSHE